MGEYQEDSDAEAAEDEQQTPCYPTPGGIRGL